MAGAARANNHQPLRTLACDGLQFGDQKSIRKFVYRRKNKKAPAPLHKALDRRVVQLNRGKWPEMHMDEVAPAISQWRVQRFEAYVNHHPSILKDICDVRFAELRQLLLGSDDIQSIEELPRIDMPRLEVLAIGYNLITRVKSMRKANWPALKQMKLDKNLIMDAEHLPQLAAETLQYICFEWYHKSAEQNDDMKWTVKLNSRQMSKLCTDRVNFCVSKRVSHKAAQCSRSHPEQV